MVDVVPAIRDRYRLVSELRTAVLWRKGASIAAPDYCIESLPTNPWIHQPFEEYDHMRPTDLASCYGG